MKVLQKLTLSKWLTSAPALHKESTILVNPLALAHNKLVMLYCIEKHKTFLKIIHFTYFILET